MIYIFDIHLYIDIYAKSRSEIDFINHLVHTGRDYHQHHHLHHHQRKGFIELHEEAKRSLS